MRFLCIAIALWSILSSFMLDSSVNLALALIDNFEDGEIGAAWSTQITGSGSRIVEEDGQLVIELASTAAAQPQDGRIGAHAISTCQVSGNFDLTAEYTLHNWPAGNGVRVSLMVVAVGTTVEEYFVSRVSFGSDDFDGAPRESYLYAAGKNFAGITATNHSDGRLRLTRWNGLLQSYYREGNNWIQLSSSASTEAALSFAVGAWSYDYAFNRQDVKVAFDNISLTGDFVCPFELPTNTAAPSITITEPPSSTPSSTVTPTPPEGPIGEAGFAAFLPSVGNAPTPFFVPTSQPTGQVTPSPSPSPTATFEPGGGTNLRDGSYQADLAGGGWLRFFVTDNGTRVSSAGFLTNYGGQCDIYTYSFDRSTMITNGQFHYADAQGATIQNELTCTATSRTSAICTASRSIAGDALSRVCGVAESTATLR